jgi:hypothetical protein
VRLRSRRIAAALLGVAWLAKGSAALADLLPQSRGVRIDQLQPASPESPFFRAEGPHNPAAEGVEFGAGLTLEYAEAPLREKIIEVSGGSTSTNLVQHALLARISGSITPLHWLAFDLSLPLSLYETGKTFPQPVGGVSLPAGKGPGVGDLRIGVHFRPIDTAHLGLIVGGRVWAPFGTPASTYLSDGTFRGELDIGVAGEFERALYGCTMNLSPGIFIHRSGDRFATGCAGHYKINSLVAVGLEPSLELLTHPRIEFPTGTPTAIQVLFEPLVAVHLRLGGFRVGLAGGPGVGGGMGSADGRLLVNAAYVGLGKPPKGAPAGPPDRDLDKIPDEVDACPDEAGPPNKDPKRNGCPVHDRDGDGILDEQDACPDKPGIPYPDPKGNGCPDSDNDGLPDPIDQCVNEPGPPPTGCPKYAHLALNAFTIDPPLDFGFGDKLSPENRAALSEIAATLRANPKIDQVSISVGTKGARPAVSDKRAQEILLVLRAANLDTNRYEVVLRDDLRAGAVQVRIVK